MSLYPEFLDKDRSYNEGDIFPETDKMEIVSHGCRLFGYTLTPGGKPGEKHPLVIVLHGFPGHTTNNDLDHALRRMGCVVMNPHYRGAWGSEGYYTFDGLIEDIEVVANWARSPEILEKYSIDPDNIFLAGHSMGGFTTVNVMRRIPWIKAGVCMAPYDMPWMFENHQEEAFRALLPEGSCLKQETPTSLFENAQKVYKELAFSQAAEDLKDRNMYFIGGAKDFLAPPADMIEPLFNRMKAYQSGAVQKYDLVNSDHGFSDMRIKLSRMVGEWIASLVD